MSNFSRGVFDIGKEGGAGLKRFREHHGIEVVELTKLTGLSEDTFYLIETGHRPVTLEIAWTYFEAYRQLYLHKSLPLPAFQMRLWQKFGRLRQTVSLIGSMLRVIREQHGSSLHTVAERFKLTAMALDKVELGKTIPRERTLAAYAALLSEAFAASPLPKEVSELLVFIRVGLARLSRAEFAKQAGVTHADIRRIEQTGQYRPEELSLYRQALVRFKRTQARQKRLFPEDLVEFRKEHGITLHNVGRFLGITESGVCKMEVRLRQKPLTVGEVLAYLEAAYFQEGALS